jgi:hypothetical protein
MVKTTQALSSCGAFKLWRFQAVALSSCGAFKLWCFQAVALSSCGAFKPWVSCIELVQPAPTQCSMRAASGTMTSVAAERKMRIWRERAPNCSAAG